MIKVQNIYYMLAYAFQVLKEESYSNLAAEEFDHASDLLAAILSKGISNQIRRGLGREYMNCRDELTSPAGKIEVSASVKQLSLLKKKLVCEYDIFTENAYINQILKTTAMLLIRSSDVATEQKKELKKLMLYFANVDECDPRRIAWSGIKYHRNNATYKMLINICYLIVEGMLQTEQGGTKKLSRFLDDQRMHKLFERFVLEYYRKHYPRYSVSAAQIKWATDDGIVEYLPVMQTDITIESAGKALIIDTKYYGKTMQHSSLYDSRTIHSNNLYQIFTYVKNKDRTGSGDVSGVLLYAKTDEKITPDSDYSMGGNQIGVKTLDLDTDFPVIEKQLERLIETYL